MIAVEPLGRTGNQMFQFAFGLAASKQLGVDFAMPRGELGKWFVLRPWSSPSRRTRRAFRWVTTRRFASYARVYVDNDLRREPEAVLSELRDRTVYSGFFQSERFFGDASSDVREALVLKPEYRQRFETQYGDLASTRYACCHIRRTDYLTWAGGAALPPSYYRRALEGLVGRTDGSVIFIGDDVDYARAEFADIDGARFEHNDPPVDLLLLMRASTVIVSNSSFAWWGAWLNEVPGKQVIAPLHWVGFKERIEYPNAVIPESWLTVPVETETEPTS